MSNIMIYGFHSVENQIRHSPQNILTVFIQENRKDNRILKIIKDLQNQEIKYSYTNKSKLEFLAKSENHQGIIAKIKLDKLYTEKDLIDITKDCDKKLNILMLDSVKDPRNFGACIRSASAAGIKHIIINKNGACPITPLVYKASAGTISQIKIFQIANLVRVIKYLKTIDFWIVGLDGLQKKSIYQIDLNKHVVFVMGSEEKGLKKLIKNNCDELVKIPMHNNVESLNISVATGITLFEALRQRKNL